MKTETETETETRDRDRDRDRDSVRRCWDVSEKRGDTVETVESPQNPSTRAAKRTTA
jgi:hypothetical protein